MANRCEQCGGSMVTIRSDARFCATRCRVAWARASKRLPAEMTSRRAWVRASGKVPMQLDGRAARSNDSATWSTFRAVAASTVGDGLGVMLGDGLGCYDFDHCFDAGGLLPEVREVVAAIPERVLFVERSMSGNGLHVFVEADEGPGIRRPGFERYTRARFIRVTGDSFKL